MKIQKIVFKALTFLSENSYYLVIKLFYGSNMYKNQILEKFGSTTKIAKYFKISHTAVVRWGEIIPEKRARQLAMTLPRVFKFNDQLYKKQVDINS